MKQHKALPSVRTESDFGILRNGNNGDTPSNCSTEMISCGSFHMPTRSKKMQESDNIYETGRTGGLTKAQAKISLVWPGKHIPWTSAEMLTRKSGCGLLSHPSPKPLQVRELSYKEVMTNIFQLCSTCYPDSVRLVCCSCISDLSLLPFLLSICFSMLPPPATPNQTAYLCQYLVLLVARWAKEVDDPYSNMSF